jgi:hypothetical protein
MFTHATVLSALEGDAKDELIVVLGRQGAVFKRQRLFGAKTRTRSQSTNAQAADRAA